MKILFTTPILQHPAAGGPYLRIENSIKALSRISELYIHCRIPLAAMGGKEGLSFYKKYCKAFYFAPSPWRDVKRFIRRVINLFSRIVLNRNLCDVSLESAINFQDVLKTADSIKADIIWLGYGNISYPLLKFIKENSKYRVVLDTDSVWSRFVLRGLPYAKDDKQRLQIEADGKAKEEEERWGTKMADVTTAVSEVDKEYYEELAGNKKKIMLFSNVIDVDNYKEKPVNKEIKRPSVYLAGTFGKNSPMEEAALWMTDRVMPILWKDLPDLHFYIVGSGSKETLAAVVDERISILGRVDSVLPYLCNVDVATVPLKFESGTRFKILEAAACNIPIVSTTLGAEGLNVTHGKNILIVDTPEEFAASIKELLSDKEKAKLLADNCRRLVLNDYSIATAESEAQTIIEYLRTTEMK